MRFSTFLAALLPVTAAFAQTNHVVKVGEGGALTFTPNSITAVTGDSVSFQFLAKNHTVTQSTFASPCTNLTNTDGTVVDSGFQPVPANATAFMQWTFTINNASAPLWFYCRQTNHCQMGMVFAINPTADKSFTAFQQKAMGATASASASSAGKPAATGSGAGSASLNPAASTGAGSPSPSASTTTNGAGNLKAGAGILLSGLGLVAGLVL